MLYNVWGLPLSLSTSKETPVQQILALKKTEAISDDAMRRLGSLLQIPREDKLRLVSNATTRPSTRNYLSTNKSVLVFDELSEELDYTAPAKSSIKRCMKR
ncbi:hypothetical protein O9929_16220 [Vibrio lentus]|nr:hypothetical protein [Vibrio lentus]